jgi:tetratricopeptide (TPR) repeat protein
MNPQRWLVVLLLLSAGRVQAGSQENKERTARLACLSGDYATGVKLLSELFLDTKDSNYVFNIARCFQQNHRYDDALAHFQEYLRVNRRISSADRAAAEKHIAECQELLSKQTIQPAVATPAATQAPAPIPVAAPQPAVSVQAIAATPPAVQQSSPRPAGESDSGLATAGIVTAAIGGAGLVAGVIFNLKFNSLTSDLQKVDGYDAGKASNRDTYKNLAWASYGMGIVCIATGGILYYLGLRSASTASSSLSLVPAISPGQAGALVKGSF